MNTPTPAFPTPQRSRNRRLSPLFLSLFLLLPSTLPADEETSNDNTEAPYFWVRGSDQGVDSLPLKSTDVRVEIEGTLATVRIRQQYRNEGSLPIEASYVFPGSTRAAVNDLLFRVGERTIRAKIQEKEEARKTYAKAKREGKRTTLLEQHRPNVFQMKVANILPSDTVEVELTYTETLERIDGQYQFVFPTVVGPRYSEEPAGSPDTQWISSPFIHPEQPVPSRPSFALSVDILQGGRLSKVGSPSHPIEAEYPSAREASVRLASEPGRSDNRDFILRFSLADAEPDVAVLVQKTESGGTFFLNIEPPRRQPSGVPVPREYLFLLDVSGSMNGFPLGVSKEIIRGILNDLNEEDSFNIRAFAGGSEVFSESGSVQADPGTRNRAIRWVDNLRGSGGTRILPALKEILAEPRPEGRSRTIVALTDGYVTVEHETFELIRRSLGEANLFAVGIGSSVNRHLIEGMARAGRGDAFVATKPQEGKRMADSFLEYVRHPVLTDIRIDFDGVEVRDLLPEKQPDLFLERPLRLVGKFDGDWDGSVRITGRQGPSEFDKLLPLGENTTEADSVDILWAREKIRALSDELPFLGEDKVRPQIVELGLTHRLLTRFTSFVAVEETVARTEGPLQSVKQPSPLPKGVSALAVGGGVPASPEPATWGLLALAALAVGWSIVRTRKP